MRMKKTGREGVGGVDLILGKVGLLFGQFLAEGLHEFEGHILYITNHLIFKAELDHIGAGLAVFFEFSFCDAFSDAFCLSFCNAFCLSFCNAFCLSLRLEHIQCIHNF